ncbi:MAG: glycosyltransferase family 4 protein [Rhodocyclaceae bacterium]|nr:glycosyltransferase family 4 protein [Rhodocyclaceae bacterium]
MNKPTRLLYVFPEPLPLRKARALQVINTVAALADQGLAIDLAYVPVAGISDPFACCGLRCPENVRLVPLSRGLPFPLAFLRTHSNRLFIWRLGRWLNAEARLGNGPQLAFARHVKLAAAMLRRFPRLPLIYEAHEIFSQPAPKLFAQEKSVIEKSAALVAITQGLADALNRYFGLNRDFAIVPSATALPAEPGSKDWTQIGQEIVYAGSFFAWKGVDDLIAATQWLPECRIVVIGGDEQGIARLRTLLPASGARVEFVGHLSPHEVGVRLARACIAILPNRAGSVSAFTSPLKLFEYMAAGCAVVVSDLPVLREVLDEHEASWFTPGDAQSLAGAVRALVDDPLRAKAMGERLSIKAHDFTWAARATRLLDVVNIEVARQRHATNPGHAVPEDGAG